MSELLRLFWQAIVRTPLYASAIPQYYTAKNHVVSVCVPLQLSGLSIKTMFVIELSLSPKHFATFAVCSSSLLLPLLTSF